MIKAWTVLVCLLIAWTDAAFRVVLTVMTFMMLRWTIVVSMMMVWTVAISLV